MPGVRPPRVLDRTWSALLSLVTLVRGRCHGRLSSPLPGASGSVRLLVAASILVFALPLADCAWQRILVPRVMGLQGSYYPNRGAPDTPFLTRLDTDIGTATLAARGREIPGGFSRVEWTGHIEALASDEYRFFARTDHDVSLFVDGAPVLDGGAGGTEAEYAGAVFLHAGLHPVLIRCAGEGGKSTLVLSWARSHQLRAPLPGDALLPPAPNRTALRVYRMGRTVLRWLFAFSGLAAIGAAAGAGVLHGLPWLSRRRHRFIVVGCLALLVVAGAVMLDDYGVSLDESIQRQIGIANYQYLSQGARRLFDEDFPERHYGPVFEILLVGLERQLGLSDSRHIFLMRHGVTFALFSVSVGFFYLLCLRQLRSWWMAVLGCACLVLSPRILADAFYNSKDLPFLSVFVISIYTLVRFLDRPGGGRAFWHALSSGVLIDIRVVGLLIPALTAFFVIGDLLFVRGRVVSARRHALTSLMYAGLTACFTVAFFPLLWEGPVTHFVEAFAKMSRFPFTRMVLYLGQDLPARMLPWHYGPVWIGVTTPLGYLGLFAVGLVAVGAASLARPARLFGHPETRDNMVWALWCLLPLGSVVAGKAVLYDGWRHLFFVYPGFVMIAMAGVSWMREWIRRAVPAAMAWPARGALALWVLSSLAEPLSFMIRYHPHENVFFNRLAGEGMEEARQRFELDYWGLSYRQGLEWILRHDGRSAIKVFLAGGLAEASAAILPRGERRRLVCVARRGEADYFLGNYRWHRGDYPYRRSVYAVRVGDTEIMSVYDLRYERWGVRRGRGGERSPRRSA